MNNVNNDVTHMANQAKDFLGNEGADSLKKGAQQVKESGQDWLAYVEEHPMQTMLFGVIGYFALKGFFKG